MTLNDKVEIDIQGEVNFAAAQAYVSRIRGALHSNVKQIYINMLPDTNISSAEFFGFLVATSRYMKENNRKLLVKVTSESIKEFIKICRLEDFFEIIQENN